MCTSSSHSPCLRRRNTSPSRTKKPGSVLAQEVTRSIPHYRHHHCTVVLFFSICISSWWTTTSSTNPSNLSISPYLNLLLILHWTLPLSLVISPYALKRYSAFSFTHAQPISYNSISISISPSLSSSSWDIGLCRKTRHPPFPVKGLFL